MKYKILVGVESGIVYHDLYRSRDNGWNWELLSCCISDKEVDNHKFVGTPIETNLTGKRYL